MSSPSERVDWHGWLTTPEYAAKAQAALDTAPAFTEATRDRLRVLLTGRAKDIDPDVPAAPPPDRATVIEESAATPNGGGRREQ